MMFFKNHLPIFFLRINNNKGKKKIDGKSKNKQPKTISLLATNNNNHKDVTSKQARTKSP